MVEEEYAAFFSRYYDSLRAYVRRRVPAADVDEVTAEVFLQAWQRWPVSGERALPWLYRAAALVILNHRRALGHRDRVQRDAADLFRDALRSGSGDAANEVVERAAAAEALARLDEKDREVLLLACWEGLGAAEIGRVLRCSAATAYVRLHRARGHLAALIDEVGSEIGQASQEPHTALTIDRR